MAHIARAAVAGIAALTLTTTLVACSGSEEAASTASSAAGAASSAVSDATSASFPREVDSLVIENGEATGDTEKVEIKAQPERIVSTSVTLTGALLALDAPVVGTGGGQPGPVASEEGFFTQWADEAREKDVESLYILEPNLEAIAAQTPDLILVSAAGADSANAVIDQLRDIAPVVVLDYSDKGWEDVLDQVAEATGLEDAAKQAMERFDARVEEVRKAITLPEQPTTFALTLPNNRGMNFWTEVSAQGQLLTDLGFDIVVPSDDVLDNSGPWGTRTDVKHVAAENMDRAITGETLFVMNTDSADDPVEMLKANPLFADVAPIKNGKAYAMPSNVFRMDYFSAMLMLDNVEKLFS